MSLVRASSSKLSEVVDLSPCWWRRCGGCHRDSQVVSLLWVSLSCALLFDLFGGATICGLLNLTVRLPSDFLCSLSFGTISRDLYTAPFLQ
jgi:hypothetical protein